MLCILILSCQKVIIGGYKEFLGFYLVIKGFLSDFSKKRVILNYINLFKAQISLILFLLLTFQQKTLNNIGGYGGK